MTIPPFEQRTIRLRDKSEWQARVPAREADTLDLMKSEAFRARGTNRRSRRFAHHGPPIYLLQLQQADPFYVLDIGRHC
jgi:hypothetical protein